MPTSRQYGRVYVPDPRDDKYRLRAAKSKREVRTWELKWLDNQLVEPRCCGSGWSHFMKCPPVNQWLDPQGMYEIAKRFDEWEGEEYDGTSVRAVADVLLKLGVLAEYRWAKNAETVANHVLEYGPVVMGTNWYEGMEVPDHRWTVHATGEVLGGHAWCITGYSRRSDLFRFANSWGRDWGRNGFAYISKKDLNKLIREDGEACVGVEQKLRAA